MSLIQRRWTSAKHTVFIFSRADVLSSSIYARGQGDLWFWLSDLRCLLWLSAALGSGAAADAVEARCRRACGRSVAAAVGGQGLRWGGAAGVGRSGWPHRPVDHQAGTWPTHMIITCTQPCAFTTMLLRAPD